MIFCLCGMVTLKPDSGSLAASEKKSRRHAGDDQERQVHGVHAPRLEGAIVHGRRDGVAHRIGNHAVDLGGLAELFDAVEMAQVARAHLPGGRAFGVHGGGVGIDAAENRREHARREAEFAHGQHDHAVLGQRLGGGKHAHIVARLARRGDDLIGVGRHLHDAVDHRVHGGRGFESCDTRR